MRLLATIALGILVVLLGIQIYSFQAQGNAFAKQAADLQLQMDKAQKDHEQLTGDSQYLQDPANLEKELRARFNYHAPDEKMIILVPTPHATTTPP